jgi:alanine racemase
MHRTSRIEISRLAYQNNLEFLRKELGNVKISSVIKGNAYGHGIKPFVRVAESCGIDHFSVFSADEAREVYKASQNNAHIMIMGFIGGEDLEWAIDKGLSFFVFDLNRIKDAKKAAIKLKKPARIHIELETGFNRTGFNLEQLKELLPFLQEHRELFIVEGTCTHYAGAESIANHVRVREQKSIFESLCAWLEEQGIPTGVRHTACSAAALTYPDTRMDMVRIGILQYGFWPSRETLIYYLSRVEENGDRNDPLKRMIRWTSEVMSLKKVGVGEFVGYGTSYLAEQDLTLATVPVGYAHGYTRALSNQGRVLIRNKRFGVISIVNMNMMMVDITDADEINEGDEVILIGNSGDKEISVASFGELSNQLNYELLVRIPHNIPREIVD